MSLQSILHMLVVNSTSLSIARSSARLVHYSIKAISNNSDKNGIDTVKSIQGALKKEKMLATPSSEFRGSDFDFPCLNRRLASMFHN